MMTDPNRKLDGSPKTKIQLLGKQQSKIKDNISPFTSKPGSVVEHPDSSGSSSFQKGYGGIPRQSLNIPREDDLTELVQMAKDTTPKFNM